MMSVIIGQRTIKIPDQTAHSANQGPYSPTILKNTGIISLILKNFLKLKLKTTSDLLNQICLANQKFYYIR